MSDEKPDYLASIKPGVATEFDMLKYIALILLEGQKVNIEIRNELRRVADALEAIHEQASLRSRFPGQGT